MAFVKVSATNTPNRYWMSGKSTKKWKSSISKSFTIDQCSVQRVENCHATSKRLLFKEK